MKKPDRSQVEVSLDGKPVPLDFEGRASLASIRARLETLALRKERILFSLSVDGVNVSLTDNLEGCAAFRKINAVSITLTELNRHLVWLAAHQLERLQCKVDSYALLVMINDWPIVQGMWWELLPDLKTPLMTLNYLPELWAKAPNKAVQNIEPFINQINQLRVILIQLDEVCEKQDRLEFSEVLEKKLGVWLSETIVYIRRFHEHAAP